MKQRNYGIDFLRIVSMFMVVILHVLGQGGILDAAEPFSVKYWSAWFLEITCYCAVNCFALISGFVMYQRRTKISKFVNLWLQTVFYTVLAAIIFFIIKPKTIRLSNIINALFPITRNHYWYVSSYFGLLVLSPVLNTAILHTPKKALGSVLLASYAIFCVLPTALFADPYHLNGGYSLIWLALLYLTGGYFSKYDIASHIKTCRAWFLWAGALILTCLSKIILELLPQLLSIDLGGNLLITYTSPTISIIAVALLIICSKQHFCKPIVAVIRILSPAALGMYLIHVNRLVWQHLIAGFSRHFINHSCLVMLLLVFLSSAAIYLICTIIELLRIKLFKLLKVDRLCNTIEARLTQVFDRHSIV